MKIFERFQFITYHSFKALVGNVYNEILSRQQFTSRHSLMHFMMDFSSLEYQYIRVRLIIDLTIVVYIQCIIFQLITYLIGHYNASVRIIVLVSYTTYVVCVNSIHKWRILQFKAGLLDVKPGFEPQARHQNKKYFLGNFLSADFW